MNVFEHWQNQREPLRSRLADLSAMADVVYEVRRAILQTEQNALADMSDDVLRQQAGVLMTALKNSVGLLEAQVTAQVWVPQKQSAKPKASRENRLVRLVSLLLMAAAAIWCYAKGEYIGSCLAVCGLITGALGMLLRPSPVLSSQDEARVTLRADAERLLVILDGQMRTIDRCINDFAYLNDQLRGNADVTDPAALSRAADLMEALYEADGEDMEGAHEAARRLLSSLGLKAVDYSAETSRFFNALPSKSATRTLSPAIVSAQDHQLLRRGTAAVKMGAA